MKTVVKWTFLTGLNRTTVENCGKMDVVVVVWWCFCGGVLNVRHVRSDERVDRRRQEFAFYHSFEHPTRTK